MKDSILALVFRPDPDLTSLRSTYCKDSSLIEPHITLMHGFVEVHGSSLPLALNAISESIKATKPDDHSLVFSRDSLNVFNHRGSTTVYADPSADAKSWLYRLYYDLRLRFRQCEDQEKHNKENVWNPHLALGKFGCPTTARSAMQEWVANDVWNGISLPVIGLTIFQ